MTDSQYKMKCSGNIPEHLNFVILHVFDNIAEIAFQSTAYSA